MDEGYVKFQSRLQEASSPSALELKEIVPWRERLFQLKLIGEYSNGVGFGNISVRVDSSREFIISGTGTGGMASLTSDYYTRVVDCDIDKNRVVCSGKVHASSESMTHAAVYGCDASINAAIHVHSKRHWNDLTGRLPTSAPSAKYGTPEMAREIARLYRDTDFRKEGVMIMGGHEEGMLSFGSTLSEAGERLLRALAMEKPKIRI